MLVCVLGVSASVSAPICVILGNFILSLTNLSQTHRQVCIEKKDHAEETKDISRAGAEGDINTQ